MPSFVSAFLISITFEVKILLLSAPLCCKPSGEPFVSVGPTWLKLAWGVTQPFHPYAQGPKGENVGSITQPLPSNYLIFRAASESDGEDFFFLSVVVDYVLPQNAA